MNEKIPCPDPNCLRLYGHMVGCRVAQMHQEIDLAVRTYGVKNVAVGVCTPESGTSAVRNRLERF